MLLDASRALSTYRITRVTRGRDDFPMERGGADGWDVAGKEQPQGKLGPVFLLIRDFT